MSLFENIPFHIYGLCVGLGVVVTICLGEYQARRAHISETVFYRVMTWVVASALIGARLWHVIDEWGWYSVHPAQIGQIWLGGLSILGALLGGAIGVMLGSWWQSQTHKKSFDWRVLSLGMFDALGLSLPFGQAIGRVGNYFNQELYGWPTTLPWGLYIEPAFRYSNFESFTHFHPLFLYELIILICFGLGLWLWSFQPNHIRVGSGWYAYRFLFFYTTIRFFLEFLRIDKSYLAGTPIGVNQSILIVAVTVLVGVGAWQFIKKIRYEN